MAKAITFLVYDSLVRHGQRIYVFDQLRNAVLFDGSIVELKMHVRGLEHLVGTEIIQKIPEGDITFADANGVNAVDLDVLLEERRVDATEDRIAPDFFF